MGDVFAGRYELVDPLAEGGSGVVWRAWDRRANAYVAAKVLRQVDAATLVRFMREQSLRVSHPHVLAPTGWAGEDDRVLLTMPIIRGGSVATLVGDHGPLPTAWVATLLDQTLAALEAIHALGLVHRDVKPANLLLDATGTAAPQLWLSDFGVATSVDEPRLTQGAYALGTPGYLAPECLVIGWEPHPAADVYAAGMCALEMLEGRRPLAGPGAAVPAMGDGGGPGSAAGAAGFGPGMGDGDGPDSAGALRSIVAGMVGRAPADRPTVTAARAALVGLRLEDVGSAGEGSSEIEVFDQIPELPDGWTEHGPVPRGPIAVALAQTLPTRQADSPPDVAPARPAPGVTEKLPVRDAVAPGPRLLAPVLMLAGGGLLVIAAILLALV